MEASDDEEEEAAEVRFELVGEDNEGDMLVADTGGPGKKKNRKKHVVHVGQDSKDSNLFIVDKNGTRYKVAEDGVVRINLAKCILCPATEEELSAGLQGGKDGAKIVDGYWRCLVPSADPGHNKWVLIGTHTGNLGKHAKVNHQPVMDALERLIRETPKEQASYVLSQYVNNLAPPKNKLTRFFGRDNDQIEVETLMLIWFLDANIAFAQFDNPLFHKLTLLLGGRVYPSSTTMVESILPVLYRFAIETMLEWLATVVSFFNSFDCWS